MKPSQEAMEEARRIMTECVAKSPSTTAHYIAEALDKARREEREAAAKIAENRSKVCDKAATHYRKKCLDEGSWEASQACAGHEARYIANAIRARS